MGNKFKLVKADYSDDVIIVTNKQTGREIMLDGNDVHDYIVKRAEIGDKAVFDIPKIRAGVYMSYIVSTIIEAIPYEYFMGTVASSKVMDELELEDNYRFVYVYTSPLFDLRLSIGDAKEVVYG